jgi:hypothetical protein
VAMNRTMMLNAFLRMYSWLGIVTKLSWRHALSCMGYGSLVAGYHS